MNAGRRRIPGALAAEQQDLLALRTERASYNGSIEASQASDVGSIPIARSINLVDSVALALLRVEVGPIGPGFWTQVGRKILG